MKKKFWKSKTLWVNLIGLIAAIFTDKITPEMEFSALSVINVILRTVTKEPIGW